MQLISLPRGRPGKIITKKTGITTFFRNAQLSTRVRQDEESCISFEKVNV
jgi:hypothetical protein